MYPTLESAYERIIVALCVYREARGESHQAKLGVAWVIKNRLADPRWSKRGNLAEIVLQPWQFSSFNHDDPNERVWPHIGNPAWSDCCAVAESQEPDPTGGAVYYFSPPLIEAPRAWGKVTPTVTIGHLHFYK